MRIGLPEDVDADEAAAIAAAVEALVREQAAALAAAGDGPENPWESGGRRWRFAGRVEGVRDRTRRVPRFAPTDPWAAAGRAERF
ncbi:acc operon protein [Halomarina ordinaria]|uniref:Acc operon protein n=1 Tax=Halomarina ordinaria TaxID=3033939 RepID=A0ABD5U7D8_9EURY|nr:acc operon protein [Halomarina sp. PSRA2]